MDVDPLDDEPVQLHEDEDSDGSVYEPVQDLTAGSDITTTSTSDEEDSPAPIKRDSRSQQRSQPQVCTSLD